MRTYDVIVIGGGPAGLAAAIAAKKEGAKVLLIEREARLGGILKQCIHDGFGLIRFGEKLSGPEYVERFIDEFRVLGIESSTLTFVTDIVKRKNGFELTAVNREGVQEYRAKAMILATGCRERTAKQVKIHGTRPSGIFTAGAAQHFVNLMGQMPAKRCVVLGSGDIGLIMARRLTLEGAKVMGVYEVKPTPSGLTRNLVQCLEDYDIPLYLSHTVTRVFGTERLEAVEIARVDEKMAPIAGTEQVVACDTLILSVGLIPENEMAEKLNVALDAHTKGPVCDNRFMTCVPGVFSCGNALHVNDLVDYVSESGELAGAAAAEYCKRAAGQSSTRSGASAKGGIRPPKYGANQPKNGTELPGGGASEPKDGSELPGGGASQPKDGSQLPEDSAQLREGSARLQKSGTELPAPLPTVQLRTDPSLQYLVPQKVNVGPGASKAVLYFRSREILQNAVLNIVIDGKTVFEKKYRSLKPPEMERLALDFEPWGIRASSNICISIRKEGAK